MVDLNDVAIFEKVAGFTSFSEAARTLGLPKSNISRAIIRLEASLGVRLFERSSRNIVLTQVGEALRERCAEGLTQLSLAIDHVAEIAGAPRGQLKISAGIGFGINVLGAQLPGFLQRYPEVSVTVDLSSKEADLVAEGVDVALRMGPLGDSLLVATKLGEMNRFLCASPAYLAARGVPRTISDLANHDTIEMPAPNGRPRTWSFCKDAQTQRVELTPRTSVNEALLIVRLISGGAGVGIISGYLCADAIGRGELVHLLPEWTLPPVEVSLVFPTRREMSPTVRAFVDYMRENSQSKVFWKRNPNPQVFAQTTGADL